MRASLRSLMCCVILAAALAAARAQNPDEKPPAMPQLGIGYEYSGLGAATPTRPMPIVDPLASGKNPLYVRIEVHWAEVEPAMGTFEWAAADSIVQRFAGRGHEPVIDLWGGNPIYGDDILKPPTAGDAEALEGWDRFVREAARHFKGHARVFQIGKTPNADAIWGGVDSAKSYAFLIKRTASIVRAEVPDAVVVAGGLVSADLEWLSRLYAEGAAPYIDVVSFRPDAQGNIGDQVSRLRESLLSLDAAAPVWLEGIAVSGEGQEAGRDIVMKMLEAFDQGASVVFFALPYGPQGVPTGAEFLVRSHSAIPAGMGRVPSENRVAFEDASGAPVAGVRSVCFYDPDQGLSAIAFWTPPGAAVPPKPVFAHLTARQVGPPIVYDPVTGKQDSPSFSPVEGGAKGEVPIAASPLFLVYKETAGARPNLPGVGAGDESLTVSATRGITADEVIAKYREFQAGQDAVLHTMITDAMIEFHFTIAGASRTVDVGMGGSYFWDTKGHAEWELRDYYLNGNKSRWKEFPELPLIQPEKVLTLPLDITFDRSYHYEYDGEDVVEGHQCHVLRFEPVDPERTLYRGRVWIDKTTWARVRAQTIQTRLDPPFLSSEEKATFAPVTKDGKVIWVISRIDGQQIFSATGRNFIVVREITFTNPRIDDPEFEARRDQAHQSSHQIIADTDKGLRYLEKDASGQRVVKENVGTRQLFGLAGAIYDPSLKSPVPLGGLNYFDYDFLKSGIQTNVFFAGVFALVTATNPNIFKSGFDLGGNLSLSALTHEDKDFREGDEIEERSLARREQSVDVRLGRQIGDFVKLRAAYELSYQSYDEADDTDPDYIPPKDTLEHSSTLFGSFDRIGYDVHASLTYAVRQDFKFWGDPCQAFNPSPPPAFCGKTTARAAARRELLQGNDFDPSAEGYFRYGVGASKEFYLPSFMKVRIAADGYGGSDLDRFSRFAFDRLGAPVRGFSGSGIRFDKGVILRAAYGFNLANVIRFDLAVDQARVKTLVNGAEWTNHTGIGISGNVLGPWKTVWELEYGYALASDVKPVQGGSDFLLVILKLF